MEFPIHLFSFSLLLSALLVGMLAIYIATSIKELTKSVTVTMWCASIWGFFYGLELNSHTLVFKFLFIILQYVGISFIAAFWVKFAFHYTSYKSKYYRLFLFALFTIPTITLILVLTSNYHTFFYESMTIVHEGNFTNILLKKAPWYYVQVAFSYSAFILGLIIIWRRFKHSNPLFKKQTKLIILAGSFPIAFNIIYQSGIMRPLENIDLTPFSFLLSFGVIGFSIIRYNLFSIKPIAQNIIFEALTRGVVVLNAKSKIVDFNSVLNSFLKNPAQIMTGDSGLDLFQHQDEVLTLLAFEDDIKAEYILTKQGNERIILVEKILISEEGKFIGNILLFEDITEQKSINAKLQQQALELQQVNNLKDKYFSIISHDLKGPIFGVKELIHLTNSGQVSQEEFMEMLPEVSRNMEQVALLLENLLAWSSSQLKGGEIVQVQEFDIHKILSQQKDILERIASEKKIKILIDPQAKSYAMADKNMIELVVRNLINNAIKFSDLGSKIKISTQDESGFVKICIEDSGKGISDINLIKISSGISFTTTGQNNESGTGLGLVLIKDYVQKNNGQLEIISEEGKGSKFSVKLPTAGMRSNS
ncbi:histidine kinase N-terminal 7TM domain-containing protein [Algoriphagus aquimarinus]|uniref:sensor histidine kinase n=1 Tax=Algoriphagus aquimarinus TaxID=237018 RepID=UPI0030D7CB7E|tara:strand:- start:695 stop:2467 length:1773 start_codon:yes stop_codon:yes gene_type:complete